MAGIDPADLSLRQLGWLAEARQRAGWERTSWVMAWVGRLNGGPFEPDKLNPFGPAAGGRKPAPPREPTAAERAAAWKAFEAGLKALGV